MKAPVSHIAVKMRGRSRIHFHLACPSTTCEDKDNESNVIHGNYCVKKKHNKWRKMRGRRRRRTSVRK